MRFPDFWDYLSQFDGKQLEAWVKIGRVIADKGHDYPAWNAYRWVETNVKGVRTNAQP